MPNPTLFSYTTEDEFFEAAKEDVLFSIKEALSHYDTCRIGLAGGSTPERLYQMLAEENLPWDKIEWIQIDERYVPSDNPESNLRMIRNALFKKANIAPDKIITFDTSLPIESAAKDMGRKLIALSHVRFPIFDLLILGAGSDGHIASLFEGDEEALNSAKYATPATATGQKTEKRLSLSILALKKSDRAILLLKGDSKRPVYDALEAKVSSPKLTALREVLEEANVKVLAYFGL